MSLPARITDFQPLATILSGEVDSEFNNLVNILNGTDQTKNIRVRSNDNSFAVARFDQLASTANIVEFFSGGVEVGRVEKDGDLVVLGLTGASGVYTFGSIPVGPNANPTTDNQLARKLYVDGKTTFFTLVFFIEDPSTAPVNAFGQIPWWLAPTGSTGVTLTRMKVLWATGSHTSGGSSTYTLYVNGSNSGFSVTLDNTNNSPFTAYENNFNDIANPSSVTVVLTTKSGTVSERTVSILIEGFQKLV